MSASIEDIQATVKQYLLDTFLPGEDPEALTVDTPLISGGILDSISTVKLVTFLEEKYGVEFAAHEISSDHLENLELIANTVHAKSSAKA